jgi:hypothetical protein
MTQALFVNVPQYYLQTDSRTYHADRMCFSSTVAMAIKFLKPDSLLGSNADDDYLKRVLRFGETTLASAQQQAIRSYGLNSTFTKRGSLQDLRRILSEGRPVPVAFLHHGPPSSPRGGGHWALLTGIDGTHVTMHDPYGELDNVNGGYPRRGVGGKNVRYTLKNWLPRWTWGGEAWILDVFNPQGQAVAPSSGQKPASVPEYTTDWKSVRAIASFFGAKWPQVVAAQWALESGWGKYPSGKNNFFGIKGSPGTLKETSEFLNGKWVRITDTFKDYASPQSGIEDLIRLWYRDYKNFSGVNRATSWEDCCRLLRSEGYATDPTYPEKLIDLIRRNDK